MCLALARYHRILKKEKLKKEKQLLEQSKDKDPEAAETLLLKMEKDRATVSSAII